MNNLLKATALALVAALVPLTAQAQAPAYPSQPIKLVVPYGAGSATDQLARRVAAPMAMLLGQGVVVDNKAGAFGTIGASYVAKAPADGYTLFFGTTQTQSVNPHLLETMPYDPLKDFTPIGRMFNAGTVLVVSSSLPVNTVEELLAYVKANPGKANFGSTGFGTVAHLPGAYLTKVSGVPLTHVPYNNAGQLMVDLARGEITMLFYPPDSVRSFIEAGTLKPLAWTGTTRSPNFPNVPTMSERKFPNFVFGAWYAVFAPAGTPQPIAAKLADALRKVAHDPKFVQEVAAGGGVQIYYAPPSELDAFIKSEYERFRQIATTIGAKK